MGAGTLVPSFFFFWGSPGEVYVVNTRERIARVDGRFVHWVRRSKGERYSIIFFSTNPKHGAPQQRAYHADFAPSGST